MDPVNAEAGRVMNRGPGGTELGSYNYPLEIGVAWAGHDAR